MTNDKLISANYLLDKVQYRIDTPGIIGSTVRDMVATTRRIIEEAPAVDAVKVVRCACCRNAYSNLYTAQDGNVVCRVWSTEAGTILMPIDGYCCMGKELD